jgi:hypothetical protein
VPTERQKPGENDSITASFLKSARGLPRPKMFRSRECIVPGQIGYGQKLKTITAIEVNARPSQTHCSTRLSFKASR